MADRWRNRGAPFPLPDGTEVGRGDIFEASAKSRTVRMRRHKLRPVPPSREVTVRAGSGNSPDDSPRWVYPGIDFGSDRAYEIARDAGLMVADLEEIGGTGKNGAILSADVRGYLRGRG